MQSPVIVDYKLSLIAAVVILSIGSLAAITVMSIMGASATSITLVGGLITPSIVALLSLIRAETTAKDVGVANTQLSATAETLDEVKQQVNGHLAQHTDALNQALAAAAEKEDKPTT